MRAPKGWGFLVGARRGKASGGSAIGILIVLAVIYTACSRMFQGCGTALSCTPAPPSVDPAEVQRLKDEGNAKVEKERAESIARAQAEVDAARAAMAARNAPRPTPPPKVESKSKHTQPKALAAPASKTCCKHCSKGKPCGDSCIARNKTCYAGPGCAC